GAESRKCTIDDVPLPQNTPELGLGTWGVRRPRIASAWRASAIHWDWREILFLFPNRSGLSDYELRDLNDEIKRQMGEERDWENHIVELCGANYLRNLPPQRRDAGQRWEGCARDEGVEVRAPFLASRFLFSSYA
ncbi:hypothetical protein K438DRAFT_2045749, partial [Mycena galopus ATCC 62051]